MSATRCCSRPKVVFTVQHVDGEKRTYFRCTRCAAEWTEVQNATDLRDPVSSEEVIDVHKALANPGLTVEEIVHAT